MQEGDEPSTHAGLLAEICDVAPNFITVHHAGGRFLYANRKALEAHGYTREEFLKLSVADIEDEQARALYDERVQCIDVAGDASFVVVHVRKDGTRFPAEVYAKRIEWNGEPAILSIATDISEREIASRRLRASEARYRGLFEAMTQGVVQFSGEGRIVAANPAAVAILGIDEDQLFGRTSLDARWHAIHEDGAPFPGEDHPAPVAARTGREVSNVVMGVFNPREKRYRWLLISAVPVKSPGSDTVSHVYAVFDDISERREHEQRLLALRAAVEQARDGFSITLLDGTISYVNPAWASMHGGVPGDFEGKHLQVHHTHEQYVSRARPAIEKLMREGSLQGEVGHVRLDGSTFPVWMSCTVLQDGAGEPFGLLALGRDISAEKEAERALAESERRYRDLFDKAPIGIFATTSRGEVLDINPAMARMLEYESPAEAVAAMHLLGNELYVDAGRRTEFLRELQEHGTVSGFEYEAFTKTGRTVWLSMNALVSARRADGSFVIEGFTWDVTERKRAEQERERLQVRLAQAQKMESIGRLAGGVAHDFNNMLGVILGSVELAMQNVDASEPIREDLEEIRGAAERSTKLTRQLLAFARRQTIHPELLNLNETVAGMLKMLQRLIGENVTVRFDPAPTVWTVRIDPGQVDQILANLVVNARDAISGAGTVRIETANAEIDDAFCAEHSGAVPGEYVLLTVSDTGVGMDRETAAHIFEPFFTTKDQGQGTGLGLATVYGIVKQNEGFIDVHTQQGVGTTFTIYLPRAAVRPDDAASEGREAGVESPGTETVLLVEDDAPVLRLATRLLDGFGYRVLVASSPREALRLIDEHEGAIDLLMTDVVMPEMSGRDLWESASARRPAMRCLYMSGYPHDVIAPGTMLGPGIGFLSKPFSARDLSIKLRELLGPHSQD